MAKSKSLDLIQVTEKVEPPVCRIANYGKYLYQQQKKEKLNRKNTIVSEGLNNTLKELNEMEERCKAFL